MTRQLADGDLVSRVIIVDDIGTVAAGKALDIAQSAPIDRYHTSVSGTSDVAAVVGAVAIVVADRAGQQEWKDDAGLALVKRIAGFNQSAGIICAGWSQSSLIERSVSELGLPRTRVFGSAPEALRSAVIAITALEAGAAPLDVSLSVLGRPPQAIVPWDQSSICGRPIASVLSASQIARLDARVARLWPPGPYALASAASRMLRTALTRTLPVHIAWVANGERDGAGSAMTPVTLQPTGIAAFVEPVLSARDRVRYDTAVRA